MIIVDWIIFTLTFCAFLFAGGLFVVLYLRYRHWEKEQIARAQEWQKRSAELLAEYRKEVCNGKETTGTR